MSRNNKEKAAYFRSLHRAGEPLALFNVWDAGSARTVADAGGSRWRRAVGRSRSPTGSPTASRCRKRS